MVSCSCNTLSFYGCVAGRKYFRRQHNHSGEHPERSRGGVLSGPEGSASCAQTALRFDNGDVANNFLQYSNLLSAGAPDESARSAEIRGEYLVCDAVRLLGVQPFILTQAALPANAVRALYERLDLRTFPSSLRNRADDRTHTLKTLLALGTVTMTRDTVEVETDKQFFSLKIVAVVTRPSTQGGVQRQQKEWIVWVGDELKDGNYKSYRTLIVRASNDSRSSPYTGALYPMQ